MARSRRALFAAVIALAPLCVSACTSTPMLPPEVSRQQESLSLDGFRNEPPLWPAWASRGYSRRLRLQLSSPRMARVVIRLDTTRDGVTTGIATYHHFVVANRAFVKETWRFHPSAAEMTALDAEIEKSKVWAIYPEYWQCTEVYLDGVYMALERATPKGYGYSQANVQCGAPYAMKMIADKMVLIAHIRGTNVESWLAG